MNTLVNENLKVSGDHIVQTLAKGSSREYFDFVAKIRASIGNVSGAKLREMIAEFNRQFAVWERVTENIVPTVARAALAEAWSGQAAALADVEVDTQVIGTGTTTPANGDTALETQTDSKTIASQSVNSNQAFNTAIWLAGDLNGTYYEHGLLINGSVLASRVLLNSPSGIAVGATDTLTVEFRHTFT
ncbi:MAG: hypothetical protein Q8Q08_12855 [Candidatus Omnitrophota bacterium]|nr:hypothetical protein [Candidatus Omnitrophota bacterium]